METQGELAKHLDKVAASLDALNAVCDAKDGWEDTGTKKDVYIDRKYVKEMGMYCMRGVGDLPSHVSAVYDLLRDFQNWSAWDKTVMRIEVIEEQPVDDSTYVAILYAAYASPAPLIIANRDFVLLSVFKKLPDGGMLYACESIEHAKCPVGYSAKVGLGTNFVRGLLKPSGSRTRPAKDEPGRSTMTYVVQLDPRGSVPAWIVNLVSVNQPLNIASMREKMEASKK